MKKLPAGQALLIIVLVVAVGLTIGIAAVSRSITNIRISTEQEESARAFSAAETGIERMLAGQTVDPTEIEGFTITTQENPIGGTDTFVFPKEIAAGDTQTIWLIGHDDDGELDPDDLSQRYGSSTIEVYWGNDGTGENPALEVTAFYDEGGTFKIKKVGFDPDSARTAENGFDGADASGEELEPSKVFAFKKSLDLPSGAGIINYALRLKLLYNSSDHLLGVKGTEDLPLQGVCYESEAIGVDSGITRRLEQCRFYKTPPVILDYVLYSESSLVK